MPAIRLFVMAASTLAAMALFVVAGDSLLQVLRADWATNALQAGAATEAQIRQGTFLLGEVRRHAGAGVMLLGVALVLAFYELLRRTGPAMAHHDHMLDAVRTHELQLLAQYRDLGMQLARCRDRLSDDLGQVGESTEHMRGAQEVRFASIEASLKRMDDTLVERLEGLAAQVSHTLQSSDSKWMADQAVAERAVEVQVARFAAKLDKRLDGIDGQLRRHGGQLSVLNQSIDRNQSANTSQFGDFMPAAEGRMNGTTGSAAPAISADAIQSLMINLADLQVDLRAERRALRKRLHDMPRSASDGTAAG